MNDFLLRHRAHDYEALMRRWEFVAREAGLRMDPFGPGGNGEDGEYVLRSDGSLDPERAVYLSAGIHGDEPAGTEGLIAWAEANVSWLRSAPVILFPCLNPVGLQENTRRDGAGIDLNREFHDASHPLMAAWREQLGRQQFQLALCLHEDYDANGIYLYELGHPEETGTGTACLEACAGPLPREPGLEVEGREFADGLLQHHGDDLDAIVEEMKEGMPEAMYLRLHHTRVSLTFETPSEYGLDQRIDAQARCVSAALAHLGLA